jgi:hypothetical protein
VSTTSALSCAADTDTAPATDTKPANTKLTNLTELPANIDLTSGNLKAKKLSEMVLYSFTREKQFVSSYRFF